MMKFSIKYANWKLAVDHAKRALSEKPSRPWHMNCWYECDGRESLRLITLSASVLNTVVIPVQIEQPSDEFKFRAPLPTIPKADFIEVSVEDEHVVFTSGHNAITVPRDTSDHAMDWRKCIPEKRDTPQIYLNTTNLMHAIGGLPKDTIIGINLAGEKLPVLIGTAQHYSLVMPMCPPDERKFTIEP